MKTYADFKQGIPSLFFIFSVFISSSLLISCSSETSPPPQQQEETVDQTLSNLGVDTAETPRSDDEGDALPDNYAPLGSTNSLQQFDELLVLGIAQKASQNIDSRLSVLGFQNSSPGVYSLNNLYTPEQSETPWALSTGDSPANLRTAIQVDTDRDGLSEIAVIYRESIDGNVQLNIYDDQVASFVLLQTLTVSTDLVENLSLVQADLNGDGFSEIVIGLVTSDIAKLIILSNESGSLSLSSDVLNLPLIYTGSHVDLIMKSGNIDFDSAAELVVVINELITSPSLTGSSRYVVFDDAIAEYEILYNAPVSSGPLNRTALVSDIDLGDIDGDNIDELVFAGLTHFDPNNVCEYDYLLLALDDHEQGLAEISATEKQTLILAGCATSPGKLGFVHVNTLDIDGDGYAEINANEYVFDDFSISSEFMQLVDSSGTPVIIDQELLFSDDNGFTGTFNLHNSSMIGADMTSDEKQDIVFYSQSTNKLEVWGLGNPHDDVVDGTWERLAAVEIEPEVTINAIQPVLLGLNVNHDGVAIAYDEGDYQLIFTEPILIATLAAAPCFDDLGQNEDACRTAYGSAESSGSEIENTLTISAGVTVGLKAEFNDPFTAIRISEASAMLKVKASLSLSHSSSYSYTEQVVYTTGPIEDTVIFTSIPYDVYTYTVTSHPDEDLMGTKLVVQMPRAPVTLQVERSFYNANVMHGGPLIDASVFEHSPGQPNTYPTVPEKDSIIANYSGALPNHWAYEYGPTTVGQGGGDTNLEVNIATESGSGISIGAEVEFEAEATAGIFVAGFSVGVSADHSLQIVHGSESIYSGTVANLPTAVFADNYYSWGLFTYLMDDHDSGQQFEVINYWVE